MAVDITDLNLSEGQEIYLPFEVTGKATAPGGGGGNAANVTAISYQIDDQDLREANTDPDLPPAANPVDFDLVIQASDCPTPDAWYLLTIYVWDDASEVSTYNVTFKRLELVVSVDKGGR